MSSIAILEKITKNRTENRYAENRLFLIYSTATNEFQILVGMAGYGDGSLNPFLYITK
jgi:hypothetical protein